MGIAKYNKPNQSIETSPSAQRAILNLKKAKTPAEEGVFLKKLHDMRYTFDEIAEVVDFSLLTIMARVKLAELDPEIQHCFTRGGIPFNYKVVTAIAGLDDKVRVEVVMDLFEKKASSRDVLKACNVTTLKVRQAGLISPANSTKVFDIKLIDEGAKQVCSRCSLKEFRSKSQCKGCAATELVTWIKKNVGVS